MQAKYQAENNKHFFAIYHFKTDDPTTPARQLWSGAVKPEGVKRILASFENSDGTPYGGAGAGAGGGAGGEKKEASQPNSVENNNNKTH